MERTQTIKEKKETICSTTGSRKIQKDQWAGGLPGAFRDYAGSISNFTGIRLAINERKSCLPEQQTSEM